MFDDWIPHYIRTVLTGDMKMEVTQSIIIVEYMLCFYKIIETFFQFWHSGQLGMLLEMF